MHYGDKLGEQQELLSCVADILIDTFGAESAVLRADQAAIDAPQNQLLQIDATCVFVNDAAGRIEANARTALASMSDGDSLRLQLAALRRLLRFSPINTVERRRRLAETTVERGGYIFR